MREADVRDALVERLRRQHAEEQQTRIVHELSLCQAQARIDLAVVNGRLTGWEIKMAADTLGRLPLQQPVYSRVFDRVWLAADARHVNGALGLIPPWWGVVRVGERGGTCTLTQVRPSRLNPDVDLASVGAAALAGRGAGRARGPRPGGGAGARAAQGAMGAARGRCPSPGEQGAGAAPGPGTAQGPRRMAS